MRGRMTWAGVLALAMCLFLSRVLIAQQEFKVPAPAPEMKVMEKAVGTWDTQVKFYLEPGKPPQESTGVWLVNIERDPQVRVDTSRKRACPKCEGVKLKRRYYSAKRRFEIDECPGCGGYWLDAGELEMIRDEMEETARGKETQSLSRIQVSGSVLRYIYQLRTGSDA